MIRLTTPIQRFTFDTDPSVFASILITYKQEGQIIVEKTEEDLEMEFDNQKSVWNVWFRFTQEETKRFKSTEPPVKAPPVRVQVRVLTHEGEALASEKYTLSVEDVLNEEVLT